MLDYFDFGRSSHALSSPVPEHFDHTSSITVACITIGAAKKVISLPGIFMLRRFLNDASAAKLICAVALIAASCRPPGHYFAGAALHYRDIESRDASNSHFAVRSFASQLCRREEASAAWLTRDTTKRRAAAPTHYIIEAHAIRQLPLLSFLFAALF